MAHASAVEATIGDLDAAELTGEDRTAVYAGMPCVCPSCGPATGGGCSLVSSLDGRAVPDQKPVRTAVTHFTETCLPVNP